VGIFAIDVASYAVMSNHYHIVIRVDVERAKNWSVEEVLERWLRLFSGPVLIQRYLSPEEREKMTPAECERVCEIAEEYRERLMNISWFMRVLNENIARKANREDGVTGHFWEGRFKSQALLDETALLSAMAYVDLNPIRAGIALTPEESDYTSIQARIKALAEVEEELPVAVVPLVEEQSEVVVSSVESQENSAELSVVEGLKEELALSSLPQAPLMPFDATGHFEQAIPFAFSDYLELVDTVGRTIRPDKRGAIPGNVPSILVRLGIDTESFIAHASRFLKEFGHAVGRPERLVALADKRQTKYLRGIAAARAICGHKKCERKVA
jgi:REP element-mobilizing transposase RayT